MLKQMSLQSISDSIQRNTRGDSYSTDIDRSDDGRISATAY